MPHHPKKLKLTAIEYYFLDIGTEDYHEVSQVYTKHMHADPSIERDGAILRAKDTLRRLHRAGFIDFFFDDSEASKAHSIPRQLNATEIKALFSDQDPWIPSPETHFGGFSFATTDVGERACYGASQDSS